MTDRQAENNVAANFSSVKGAVKKPKFNRAFCKNTVQVKTMIAGGIVMHVTGFVGTGVPNVGKCFKGLRLPAVDGFKKLLVNLLTVIDTRRVDLQAFINQVFLGGHQIDKIFECVRCMILGTNVNVYAAFVRGLADGTGLTKLTHNLLKGFNIGIICKNWSDKLNGVGFIGIYCIQVKSGNIDLYTHVSFPLKDMPCDNIRVFDFSKNVWKSEGVVLVDGVVVSSMSKLDSAIGRSLKSECLINFIGNKRPILSIDRNSIVSFSDDLIQESSDLVPKLADELVKCINSHIAENELFTNSQEAITTLEIVIRKFPSIAEQIIDRLPKTQIGEISVKELMGISGFNTVNEFLKNNNIELANLDMRNLYEVSREVILGKTLAAKEINVEDTSVSITTDGYLSIITPQLYDSFNSMLSLSTVAVRADEWNGKYAEFDLISQLWPIIPARLFDNICSNYDTNIIVEKRSRKIPSYGNSLSGIAQLDPILINPKFGISGKVSSMFDRHQACYVGTCENIENMFWLPELYNYSVPEADRKDYVLFVYIAPRELNNIEQIKLHDYEESDPIYVRGIHEGWSILFVGHAKHYTIIPGLISRTEIIEYLPKSLLNHEVEDRTYYNLDGTKAF